MRNINYALLGTRIKEKRLAKGLTQEKLSELCNISTGFLGHIEHGTRTPSFETLFNIACALDCGIDSLVCDFSPQNDYFLTQIASKVKQKGSSPYEKFCNLVKILAENIDDI